nr:hypothetical protein [Prevotella sp.]
MQIVNPPVKLDVIQVVMSLAEVAVKVAALTLALAVVKAHPNNKPNLFIRL